ncbi:hypothetical protein N9W34_02130 [Rickettsiales bacterium]|nr:hypothetical protein [Rickettsiales bacterium]
MSSGKRETPDRSETQRALGGGDSSSLEVSEESSVEEENFQGNDISPLLDVDDSKPKEDDFAKFVEKFEGSDLLQTRSGGSRGYGISALRKQTYGKDTAEQEEKGNKRSRKLADRPDLLSSRKRGTDQSEEKTGQGKKSLLEDIVSGRLASRSTAEDEEHIDGDFWVKMTQESSKVKGSKDKIRE